MLLVLSRQLLFTYETKIEGWRKSELHCKCRYDQTTECRLDLSAGVGTERWAGVATFVGMCGVSRQTSSFEQRRRILPRLEPANID